MTDSNSAQIDLFEPILKAYATSGGEIVNEELYQRLSDSAGVPAATWGVRVPIGLACQKHSPARRKVRWYQQTLKQLGLIERVPNRRGAWRATAKGREQAPQELTPAMPGSVLVAFSTELGVALWARCTDVFARIGEPIHLVVTSPPYCLAQPRAYGNPTQDQYVDFICESLEPIVRNLAAGGSIALNISNDIFLPKSPARSIYRARLVIALHDRLGLSLMDELIWHNPSKAPGPIQWASKTRFQLNTGYEPIYWFTNDPSRVRSNNQRVLQPHSERHLKLMARGGESREAVYGDGTNKLRHGSFGKMTAGRIPRNVIEIGHRCHEQNEVRKAAVEAGLPVHGATMPQRLASFLIKFLSEEGDLVVDPFGGWNTTAAAAETTGRRWMSSEMMRQYAVTGAVRFESAKGFAMGEQMAAYSG